MRKRKSLFAVVFTLMISIALIAAMGIGNVSAQPPEPEIVIYAPYGWTGSAGAVVYYQVNIRNAPHTDAEVTPPADDKTWSWSLDITWDPTVLECVDGMVFEDRELWGPGIVYAWFGYFGTWVYQSFPPPAKWVKTEYPNAFVSTIKTAEGRASVGCSLYASPDPTTQANPSGNPQYGLHLGTNYDLPYTAGLPGDAYYPADELNLFWISFNVLADGPPASARINIENTNFFGHDATTTYHVSPTDAWFGVIGPHMHYTGSPLPPGDPRGTTWHEIYPDYCNTWELTSWEDNGDGFLSVCDLIDMTPIEPGGPVQWFHVEDVTITLTVSLKPDMLETMYVDFEGDIEPFDYPTDPVGTQWHELYPVYCNRYELTGWEDSDGSGDLNPSDQIELMDKETGAAAWYHVDDVSTDIIIKPEPGPPPEFPLGIGILMIVAPLIPLTYLWRRKGWKK